MINNTASNSSSYNRSPSYDLNEAVAALGEGLETDQDQKYKSENTISLPASNDGTTTEISPTSVIIKEEQPPTKKPYKSNPLLVTSNKKLELSSSDDDTNGSGTGSDHSILPELPVFKHKSVSSLPNSAFTITSSSSIKKKKVVRFTEPPSSSQRRSTLSQRSSLLKHDLSDDDERLQDQEEDSENDVPEEDDGDGDNECWYTRIEIKDFQRSAKQQIRQYQRQQKVWMDTFVQDLLSCGKTAQQESTKIALKDMLVKHNPPPLPSLEVPSSKVNNNDVVDQGRQEDDSCDDPMSLGLLVHLDPRFVNRRRLYIKNILYNQEKFNKSKRRSMVGGDGDRDSSSSWRLLRVVSLKSSNYNSQPSKIFARWLALKDYKDVVNMIRQELVSMDNE